ncbi:MAG: hypothetical protein A2V66_03650 [Ignavibacteria bacterium RBG_13_36_8]|nr:MAG: hypothetical protein A2V66_03650 [Ignavibacteria bacterium RBG_13_36_8]
MLNFPKLKLYAGDTWTSTETLADYPASEGWSLSIFLRKGTTAAVEVESSASGDDHVPLMAASETADLPHGQYNYAAVVSKDDETYTIESGIIPVLPNLDADADPRSYWEIVYETYKTAYQTLASREVEQISVLGDSYTYANRSELLKLLKNAEMNMKQEKGIKTGGRKIFRARLR